MKISHLLALLVFPVAVSPTFSQNVPAAPAAQQSPADQASLPTIRTKTEIVTVPVVVRDKHGQPVTGLTKSAFALAENGQPREISTFEEVAITGSAPSAVQDPGFSNLPLEPDQRVHVTIVVLDLINTTEFQRTDAKDQLIRFFSKDMPPGEPVSLLCLTPDGVQLVHPFTSDHGTLVESLRKLKLEHVTLGYRVNVIQETMKQVRAIAKAYAGVPGRKTMIWTTAGIPYPDLGLENQESQQLQMLHEFEDTWQMLLSANVAVYPTSVLAPSSFSQQSRTMQAFASRTGGFVCAEANDLKKCWTGAIQDSRSYYMLSYSLPEDDRKPGWRTIKVKIEGKPFDVRAREGFYYGDAQASGKTVSVRDAEITALASSLPASGVLMNVRVLPPPSNSPKADKVETHFLLTIPLGSVTVDPTTDPSLNLEVGAIALNAKRKEGGEFLHPVKGSPSPEILQRLAKEGLQLEEKLALIPGAYDVRFFVRDNASGQIGTVVFPLEVR